MTFGTAPRRPKLDNDDAPARLTVEDRPRTALSRVWLLPLLAVVIALGIAWQSYQSRGPLIEIAFESADGVQIGQTQLRYRDVSVGMVEDTRFSDDLSSVIVLVRVNNQIASFLDEGARFWIVKPEVSARGVSGLGTVLSGVYIEGIWDAEQGEPERSFVGLSSPPLVQNSQTGLRFVLETREDVQLVEGAPILLKGLEVGRLGTPELQADGATIRIAAFIQDPHDNRITTSTRFWDVSGFSLSLGASGVSLNVESLASLIQGGVSFDTVLSGGAPVDQGHVFTLFPDETNARQSLFESVVEQAVVVSALFDGSVAGLREGAAVRFRGIRVGEVSDLAVQVDRDQDSPNIRLQAIFNLRPDKLGLDEGADQDEVAAFLEARIAEGLRARIASDGLLGGDLLVELAELPEATEAALRVDEDGIPVIPDAPAETGSFAASAEGVFERINALPIEEVLESTIALLDNANRVVGAEATQRLPGQTSDLLEDARTLVASQDLRAALTDLRQTSADLQAIVAGVAESQAVANLTAALERADDIAKGLQSASNDLPELTERLSTLAAKAEALPLEDLVTGATDLVNTADTFLGAGEAEEIPGALSGALDELRQVLSELREGGAVGNLNRTLANADQAADDISEAAKALPNLSQQLGQTLSSLNAFVASYDDRSRFNEDTLTMLREVQEAAEAVSSLARTIERNPNSLLIGR